jgi:hypothetical protein
MLDKGACDFALHDQHGGVAVEGGCRQSGPRRPLAGASLAEQINVIGDVQTGRPIVGAKPRSAGPAEPRIHRPGHCRASGGAGDTKLAARLNDARGRDGEIGIACSCSGKKLEEFG